MLHGGREGDGVRRGLVSGSDLWGAPAWLYKGSQVGFTRVLVDYVLESFPCTASRGLLGFMGHWMLGLCHHLLVDRMLSPSLGVHQVSHWCHCLLIRSGQKCEKNRAVKVVINWDWAPYCQLYL